MLGTATGFVRRRYDNEFGWEAQWGGTIRTILECQKIFGLDIAIKNMVF
jgi:hypothetical protein